MNNFTKRTLTGLLFTVALVVSLATSQYSMLVMTVVIAIICITEYYNMVKQLETRPQYATGYIIALTIIGLSFLISKQLIPVESCLLIIPLTASVFIIQLYQKHKKPIENIGFTFLPIIHVAMPLSLLILLSLKGNHYDYQISLGILFMIWASDTFAYLVGILIGRTPLFPRISPKKSWEGLIGGVIATFLTSQLISTYWHTLNPMQWGILSIIVAVTGIWGDLIESMIKRAANVKDSGTILPGHGGLLDRFDSFFMVMPFAFTYIYLISN